MGFQRLTCFKFEAQSCFSSLHVWSTLWGKSVVVPLVIRSKRRHAIGWINCNKIQSGVQRKPLKVITDCVIIRLMWSKWSRLTMSGTRGVRSYWQIWEHFYHNLPEPKWSLIPYLQKTGLVKTRLEWSQNPPKRLDPYSTSVPQVPIQSLPILNVST